MNYKRGFQRLYAVLTLTWAGLVLLTAPSDRLRFWTTPADAWTIVSERPIEVSPDAVQPLPKSGQWQSTLDGAAPTPFDQTRIGKALWLVSYLVLVPGIGYTALFYLFPWIYRGFSTSNQN